MSTPEQLARIQIDAQLSAAGWTVQSISDLNLHASHGVVVREMQSQLSGNVTFDDEATTWSLSPDPS